MKVSFIGAGKVGTALAKFISSKDEILYFYSKNHDSACKAADYLACKATDDLKTLIEASEIVFITTPDHQIENVVQKIVDLKVDLNHKMFVHTSGAHPSDLLKDLKEFEAHIFSIHPLQSFSSIDKAVKDLEMTYFAYESKSEILLEWLKKHTSNILVLKPEDKVKYHLAACVFSNYLVTLMDFGNQMLSDLSLDVAGMTAMYPLIQATLSNILNSSPKEALTGPIKRGDINTLEKHLKVLNDSNKNLYLSLAKQTTKNLIDDHDKKEKLNELWRSYE